jgi:hypothetical protein
MIRMAQTHLSNLQLLLLSLLPHSTAADAATTNLNLRAVGGHSVRVWYEQVVNNAMPQAVQHTATTCTLYYHRSEFERVIDMQRHERTICVQFDNHNGSNNRRISTTDESVDEGHQTV